MFNFPNNLYTDVRIENISETIIMYTLGKVDDSKVRKYKAAFIRVFDGNKWYYSAISDLDSIQSEIDTLASYAHPEGDITKHPVVQKFQVNTGKHFKFEKEDMALIPRDEKEALLKSYFPLMNSREMLKMWRGFYLDRREEKEFYSSKGAELNFDSQRGGFGVVINLADGGKKHLDIYMKASNYFEDLKDQHSNFENFISKCESFLQNAVPVNPGKYTVILSPETAGIFAHESFGHKSESDFMIGDEATQKEWVMGKKVGSDILSIVDDGNQLGSGYVPFDDEGTKAERTFLIRDGILTGRLHSASTAAFLEEEVTGNARALSFEFEPIVRMTSTFILPGNKSEEELFGEVEDGIYVERLKHGSGLSTFTLAPSRSYFIKNGKIAGPVNISVITGNVFKTLGDIEGISNELNIHAFVGGGCGKNDQAGLSVGFGGPFVKIKDMNVT